MSNYPAMDIFLGKKFKATQLELREYTHMNQFIVEDSNEVMEVTVEYVFYRGFWFICTVKGRDIEYFVKIGYVKKKLNYEKAEYYE